jgi:hypothetical protein
MFCRTCAEYKADGGGLNHVTPGSSRQVVPAGNRKKNAVGQTDAQKKAGEDSCQLACSFKSPCIKYFFIDNEASRLRVIHQKSSATNFMKYTIAKTQSCLA